MQIISALTIIGVSALIHASFQLSVSVLTLLSGHAIGAQRSHRKLLRLVGGFVSGVAVMTMLIISFTSLVLSHVLDVAHLPSLAWAVACGLLFGIGLAVWSFYYERGKGTALWLPRGIANYLNHRSKATKESAEAFGLGLSSVVLELIFIIAPVTVSSLVLIQLSPIWQLIGIGIYTVISLLSLLIVAALIGSGHQLSRIQKWREDNKIFLQFAAGSGLLILGFYIYVDQVTSVSVSALGGY
jgi:hypothetical protein